MDNNTVYNLVHAVDTYFGLTGIINEQTRHRFASLLIIEDAENWYDTKKYTSNAIWGALKSDKLSCFKSVDYDRLNCKALFQCGQCSFGVSEYIRAF